MADMTRQLTIGYAAWAPGQTAAWWGPGEHQWNIAYTFSGRIREILPQGESEENPGDFMVLKPGGRHRWEVPVTASVPWRVVWCVFMPKPEWIPLLDLPEELPRFSRIPLRDRKVAARVGHALLEAYRLTSRPGGGEALAMNALERAFLWLQEALAQTNPRRDPRVRAILELFSRRVATPPRMEEVARACGLSPSRLGELFRDCTGDSPRAWLEHTRLTHGRSLLLTTGLPVKLVAAACGYTDQRHFATRFRRLFGMSPSACRCVGSSRGQSATIDDASCRK